MYLTNVALSNPQVVQNLGQRFRDYRIHLRMTRKEVAERAGVGMTTLYKFETGNMKDLTFDTMLRLLRAIGLGTTWENLIPDMSYNPYIYHDNEKKIQRIRHPKK